MATIRRKPTATAPTTRQTRKLSTVNSDEKQLADASRCKDAPDGAPPGERHSQGRESHFLQKI